VATVDKAASEEASYDHLKGFYDKVGEDGRNLTSLCKLTVDKIIVICGCIWAVAIITIKKARNIWEKKEL